MAMDVKDWYDLASVYRAGADRARGWVFNGDRKQDAEVLDAQADRCEEIARERDGNPPVVHEHYHSHLRDDGQEITHWHKHAHGRGKAGHDLDPVGHWHEPARPLFPAREG